MAKIELLTDHLGEIVNKLIGPVDPVGDAAIDTIRIQNLKVLTGLIKELYSQVCYIHWNNAHKEEESIRRACAVIQDLTKDISYV